MRRPDNPYVTGGSVGSTRAFVGRDALLADLEQAVRRPGRGPVVVVGPRLSGKTSLLDALTARLRERMDLVPVPFDVAARESWLLDDTVRDLADAIAAALELTAPDLGQWPAQRFRERWLETALSGAEPDTVVVLVIDEFDIELDSTSRHAAAAFLPYLADLLGEHEGRLALVLATGRTMRVDEAVVSQVFTQATRRRLGYLERREARALTRLSEDDGSLRWQPEAMEEIWWLTRGHPALTQHLCAATWTTAWLQDSGGDVPLVTAATVRGAAEKVLDEAEDACRWTWDGLSPACRVVAATLAEREPPSVPAEGLPELLHQSGVRVVTRELEEAPRLLQGWELFEAGEDPVAWRVELLRRWVKRHHPVARIQGELDHLRPEAERAYSRAVRRWEAKRADEALALLKEALDLNPNHFGATELLAEVHLARGEEDEALRLLERLHAVQPGKARPRLVKLLLERAERTPELVARLRLLDRVLEVAPGHMEASAARLAVVRQQAEEAAARGDLETARVTLSEAGLEGAASAMTGQLRERQMAQARDRVAALEATGRLVEALQVAERAARELEDSSLGPTLDRLRREVALAEHYQRGVGALQAGDRRMARENLAQVMALQPDHKDAVRLLYQAVHGVDPLALQERQSRMVSRSTLLAAAFIGLVGAAGWGATSFGYLPLARPAPVDRVAAAEPVEPEPPVIKAEPEPLPVEVSPPAVTIASAETVVAPVVEKPPPEPPEPAPTRNAGWWSEQGWRELDRGDLGGAASAFAKALDIDPRSAGARYGLGYVSEQQGARERAVSYYCDALGMSRGNLDLEREINGRLRMMDRSCP